MVTLELVYDPKLDSIEVGTGFSHIAVQVKDPDAILVEMREKDVIFDEPQRPSWPKTCFICDPRFPLSKARRE